MTKNYLLIAYVILLFGNLWSQRFLTPTFRSVTTQTNVVYGADTNYLGNLENLKLDLYQPANDVATNRPLIVFLHGGGFYDLAQTKSLPHIVDLCTRLASMGYVVASADYRIEPGSLLYTSNRMVVNAMHDAKAAIRFFKANAVTYGLDTNRFIIGGESAGASTAMNSAHIDKIQEVNFNRNLPYSRDTTVEGNGGNPGYNSIAKATMCLCGGTISGTNQPFFDTTSMEQNEEGAPYLLNVYGSNDLILPTVGSENISIKARNIWLYNEEYPISDVGGLGHCPWSSFIFSPRLANRYMNTLANLYIPRFAYTVLSLNFWKTDKFDGLSGDNNLFIFPNPSNGIINFPSNEILRSMNELVVYDLLGRTVYNSTINSQEKSIDLSFLNKGMYNITGFSNNAKLFTSRFVIE